MKTGNSQDLFFCLLRAGLFPVNGKQCVVDGSSEDWNEVIRQAEEQSEVGLIAAGIEKGGVDVPLPVKLQLVGETLQIEQQNLSMNDFLAKLIEKLRNEDIYAILMKGQGVAQCYERPLWRTSGDVDLFLSDDNYHKAKKVLTPLASSVEGEYVGGKHLGMTIDGFVVELHGCLHCPLSGKIIRGLKEIQDDTFYGGNVRSWKNKRTQIFMMGVENDITYVFVHFLNHFYKEGVGLRQICDWCRLLWTYRDNIDRCNLEKKIRQMGLMTGWKAFATVAVKYLGMPKEAMPFYEDSYRWDKKAGQIVDFVLMSGNFGHNRGTSYFNTKPYLVRKAKSLGRRLSDAAHHFRIFPVDTLRFMPYIVFNGLRSAVRGEG